MSEGERRWILLEMKSLARPLVVVYTIRGSEDRIRNNIGEITLHDVRRINIRDEYDFSKGKRVVDILHLAELQNEARKKMRTTIRLDDDVLDFFRNQAEK